MPSHSLQTHGLSHPFITSHVHVCHPGVGHPHEWIDDLRPLLPSRNPTPLILLSISRIAHIRSNKNTNDNNIAYKTHTPKQSAPTSSIIITPLANALCASACANCKNPRESPKEGSKHTKNESDQSTHQIEDAGDEVLCKGEDGLECAEDCVEEGLEDAEDGGDEVAYAVDY